MASGPSQGRKPKLQFRVEEEKADEIEDLRWENRIDNRSEVIRRLVNYGLAHKDEAMKIEGNGGDGGDDA